MKRSSLNFVLWMLASGAVGFLIARTVPRAAPPPQRLVSASQFAGEKAKEGRGTLPPPTRAEPQDEPAPITQKKASSGYPFATSPAGNGLAPGAQAIADLSKSALVSGYADLFSSLGVPDGAIPELVRRIEEIHVKKVDLNLRMTEVAQNRFQYRSALRQLLAPEAYEKYLAIEEQDAARRELGHLTRFLSKQPTRTQIVEPDRIVQLILSSAAYTPNTTGEPGGVFSDVRLPTVGSAADMLRTTQPTLERFIASSTALLEAVAADDQLAPETKAAVQEYYTYERKRLEWLVDGYRNEAARK